MSVRARKAGDQDGGRGGSEANETGINIGRFVQDFQLHILFSSKQENICCSGSSTDHSYTQTEIKGLLKVL